MSKILLVEDEASLRELYAEVLAEASHEVIQAADGQDALPKIKEGSWDILLLDIMLPKIDGIQVLKNIKDDPVLALKPVLVMSNLQDDAITHNCMELGAREFLVKSNISPPDIVTAITKYLPNANDSK